MINIKSITGQAGIIGEDKNIEYEYKCSYKEFDLNQNLVKDQSFIENGEFETATEYKYNDQDKLIEEIVYVDSELVGERISYKYNENGALSCIEHNYTDVTATFELFTYYGSYLSVKIQDENNILNEEKILEFDENENLIDEKTYDEARNIKQQISYEYDHNFKMISSTEFGETGEFVVKKVFEYDDKGNEIKVTSLSERGKITSVIENGYNENGDIIWQRIDDLYLVETSYDEKNRVIKEEQTNLINEAVEHFRILTYNENDLIDEEIIYEMGIQYGVSLGGGTNSYSRNIRYSYEYY